MHLESQDTRASRQASRQASTLAGRQASWQAGRLAGRLAELSTDKRTDSTAGSTYIAGSPPRKFAGLTAFQYSYKYMLITKNPWIFKRESLQEF
jgi:hypothetical protein